MIKRILGGLAVALAFTAAFVLVKEFKTSWFASSSMQEAGAAASSEAERAIRTAKIQATPDKSATEVLAEKGRRDMTAALNDSATDKRKLISASNFFFGAYFLNTRSRPDYCASLGVNIGSFVAAYAAKHKDLFSAAEKLQIDDFHEHGYTYDLENFYKMMSPSLEKYIMQDMKDMSVAFKASERDVCESFERNATKWADGLDYRKRAPEVSQLLLRQ